VQPAFLGHLPPRGQGFGLAAQAQVLFDDPEVEGDVVPDEVLVTVGQEEGADLVGAQQTAVVATAPGRRGEDKRLYRCPDVYLSICLGIEGQETFGTREATAGPRPFITELLTTNNDGMWAFRAADILLRRGTPYPRYATVHNVHNVHQ
jgi:hypothetical protein